MKRSLMLTLGLSAAVSLVSGPLPGTLAGAQSVQSIPALPPQPGTVQPPQPGTLQPPQPDTAQPPAAAVPIPGGPVPGGPALSGPALSGPTLAANLPAGALLTLETRGAAAALGRLSGLLSSALPGSAAGGAPFALTRLLPAFLGRESSAGVYTVGTPRGGFHLAVLVVARPTPETLALLGGASRSGARVGDYGFSRARELYSGAGGGLIYLSSDKTLLMSYLGRLSGTAAPRLNSSSAYAAPRRAVGEQQFSVYANFSAAAKLARAELAQLLTPRLFSPLVDGLDTLGSLSAGFSTTDQGLRAQSAEQPNAAGSDRPLYRILTYATDFRVQGVIPASAEAVHASACAPESRPYAARWLTRLDLLDPSGFLSDSQLAASLEQSSRYLGDECAQVTLEGGTLAGLQDGSPGAGRTVNYQRVSDMAAARTQLPAYVDSVNAALRMLPGTLDRLGQQLERQAGDSAGNGGPARPALSALQVERQLAGLKAQLADLQLVYGFRGDYLLTSYSQQALDAALQSGGPVLADDGRFRAAGLNFTGSAGWSYARALPPISPRALQAAVSGGLSRQGLTGREGAQLAGPLAGVLSGVLNRYGGSSAQYAVRQGLVLGGAQVRFDWSGPAPLNGQGE